MSRVLKGKFSPLRYPGGKGKLSTYLKEVIELNGLHDCQYVEPYAGGAGIALDLLLHEYVLGVHINDLSRPVHAFWNSVLHNTDELCSLITKTKVNVKVWDSQKEIFRNEQLYDDLELGFATFFLNRTNRSGILNAGIIGGRSQESEWGITARYNKENLVDRIRIIANMKDRIQLTKCDAAELIRENQMAWKHRTLIYFDPPYYEKGKRLYHNYYKDDDHAEIAKLVGGLADHNWVVSYDNHERIQELFEGYRSATYDIGYSARTHSTGTEIMFFSESLKIPEPNKHMKNFCLAAA